MCSCQARVRNDPQLLRKRGISWAGIRKGRWKSSSCLVSLVAQQPSAHLTVSNNIALHCKSTRGNRRDLVLPIIPPLTSQGRRKLTCDRKSAWREWRERSHWEGDFIDDFLTRAEAILQRRGISFALPSLNRLRNCEGHSGLCGRYKITCSKQQSGITKRVKISDYIAVKFSSFKSVGRQIMDLPGLPPCYDSTRNCWGVEVGDIARHEVSRCFETQWSRTLWLDECFFWTVIVFGSRLIRGTRKAE